MNRPLWLISTVLMASALNFKAAVAANFVPLGNLPGAASFSVATAISGDGSTVVGSAAASASLDGPLESVRWRTPTMQVESLRQTIVDDGIWRQASDVSTYGELIAVTMNDYSSMSGNNVDNRPFRWRQSGGFEGLVMAPTVLGAHVSAMSADGAIVVGSGYAEGAVSTAYRWSSQAGMQLLGALPTDPIQAPSSFAVGISGDGSILVGGSTAGADFEAFRWTEATGLVSLGDLPGGLHYSAALDISRDGSTIVGASSSALSPYASEAFRWTSQDGMTGLGFLDPLDASSSATFASADGRLIFGNSVGYTTAGASQPAQRIRSFVWSGRSGMRGFVAVLTEDYGLTPALAGWTGIVPEDISDDSLTIVGSGVNPNGQREAWLVRLDHPIGVPEPAAAALLLICAVALVQARREVCL